MNFSPAALTMAMLASISFAFPAFGIPGGDAHLMVNGEAAMAPGEHLTGQRRQDRFSSNEEAEHLAAQPLAEKRLWGRRQRNEASRSFEDAVSNERMHMGVEVDQLAEGLDEEDEARAGAGHGGAVCLRKRSRDDAAELSEERPTIGEECRMSFGTVKTNCRCGTGRSTHCSTYPP